MSNWWINFWCWIVNEEAPKEPIQEVVPYCPIVELLESEPYSWEQGEHSYDRYSYMHPSYYREERKRNKRPLEAYNRTSLVNLELKIEIEGAFSDYSGDFKPIKVIRNGHELPVNKQKIRNAVVARDAFVKAEAARKKREDADAELNRLSNDVHSIRVKRMMEMRKQLALDEQAEIEAKLVSLN